MSINESVNTISNESQATTSSSSSSSSISSRRQSKFPRPGRIDLTTSSNLHSSFQFTTTPSSSPTELSISSNSLTHRRHSTQRSVLENNSISQQPIKGRASVSNASLRSSLDIGMAAVRRWVRSRTAATASAAQNGPRPSRAAMQLQQQNDGDNTSKYLLITNAIGRGRFFCTIYG